MASSSSTSPSASASLLDAPLSQDRAASLFDRTAFVLLDPPPGSAITLTLDASPYYTTSSSSSSSSSKTSTFQGFKLIPDGFHIFTISADADAIPIRGVLRHTAGHQVLLRTLSQHHTLIAPDQPASAGTCREAQVVPQQPQTVTSLDHLRSIDGVLVPYAYKTHSAWTRATAHLNDTKVGPVIVARVCGIDEWTGDAHVDSFSEFEGGANGGSATDTSTEAEKRLEEQLRGSRNRSSRAPLLRFTNFDLKRSWKPGTIGTDLTRWSVDKSWLLADTVQRAGGLSHLLAELELAFILAHRLHSPSCLTHWINLLSLFSRSAHACSGAPAHFSAHPADPRVALRPRRASPPGETEKWIDSTLKNDAHSTFLATLLAQLQLVVAHAAVIESDSSMSPDFFTSLHSSLESDILKELSTLRRNISAGLASRARAQMTCCGAQDAESSQQHVQRLLAAWRALSHFTKAAFGWTLDEELDEEAEVREEDEADTGEDAPVVVELEDEYGEYE